MKIPHFFPDKWEISPDFPQNPNFPMFVPKTNEIFQFGDNFPKSGSAEQKTSSELGRRKFWFVASALEIRLFFSSFSFLTW